MRISLDGPVARLLLAVAVNIRSPNQLTDDLFWPLWPAGFLSETESRRACSWGCAATPSLRCSPRRAEAPGVCAMALALLAGGRALLPIALISYLRQAACRPSGFPGPGSTPYHACSRPAVFQPVGCAPVYLPVCQRDLIGCGLAAAVRMVAASLRRPWCSTGVGARSHLACRFPRRFSRRSGDGDAAEASSG